MLSLEQQTGDNLIPYSATIPTTMFSRRSIIFNFLKISSVSSLSLKSVHILDKLVYKLPHWHRFSKDESERERGKWTDGQNLSLMADVCDCRVSLKRAARFEHWVFSNHLTSSVEIEVHSGHWWESRRATVHHSPNYRLAGCFISAYVWCFSETQSGYVATLCKRCRLSFAWIRPWKWYRERPHSIDFKCI